MKKILAFLLFFTISFCTIAVSIAEEEEPDIFTSGEWGYTIQDDGTAVIVSYSGSDPELVIPSQLEGKAVTGIESGAFKTKSFTSVTIPDSVTSIGDNPFNHCTALSEIIVSPDHPYLATIDGVLFSKPDKRLVCYPITFTSESYTIPQGIQVIGNCAFITCTSLVSVTIPDSVTSIGTAAFAMCNSLSSVTIPDSVTSIGINPFNNCIALSEIVVSPDHPYLATIDGVLFSKPDKRLVCYTKSFTSGSYTIPQGIQVIGNSAFASCSSLTSVTIPDSVTSIRAAAFQGCKSLSSVTIPDSVTSIEKAAFQGCKSLSSVTIPDSVTSIGKSAFDKSNTLTVTVSRDSYAKQYCEDNGIKFTYPDANDWLND